jgi:hypothetical protein
MELLQQPASQPASKRQRIGTEPGKENIFNMIIYLHCKLIVFSKSKSRKKF